MSKIAKIRLANFCATTNFLAGDIELRREDICILEGEKNEEITGKVATPPFDAPADLDLTKLKKVLRKATKEDLEKMASNTKDEEEVFRKTVQKIKERDLKMKLIKVEKSFDGARIVFYFTAETRVDFRELVKDLAYELRTRIEMRQIGVRDQARIVQGYGNCGRALCCTYLLTEFEPVSIKMAKLQNLTLNTAKISGVCGRLMCCLKYENEVYKCINKDLPKFGKKVTLKDGKKGKVRKVNTIARTLIVELEDGTSLTVNPEDLTFDCCQKESGENTEE